MSRVDFHSHILPGVDDGSRSVEESLKMLVAEAEQGIRKVLATPHFYAHRDTLDGFLHRREVALAALREAGKHQPDLPEIIPGAEVFYFSGMSESESISELTIGDGEYLLLEMPWTAWTPAMYREIEAIHARRGIIPIIAHIDRYIRPFRTHGIPERLAEMPVLVQANGSFFLDRGTSRMAMGMLKKGRIQLLGSDCHDLEDRRPNLGPALRAIEKRLGAEVLLQIQEHEKTVLG